MADFPLLNEASLVMIPGATKEGKVYSQVPTDGSGDFTFTRSTTATRVNEAGNIEKGYENTILDSNDWSRDDSSYTITGGEAGYDGTNDAWLVNKLAAAYFSKNSLVLTGVQTISFFAKAGSLDRIFVFIGGDAARFDLTNGTALSAGGNPVSQNIELVSGTTDWYRCSIVLNKTSTQNLLIKPQNSSNQDVTGTIYIQDAQLNQGLVAYPYLETTTAPVYGGLQADQPRLDYTDATCPSLLLEPSRTNALPHSEFIQGVNFSIGDFISSPEGVANGVGFIPSSTNTAHYISLSAGGLTIANSSVVFSFYVKEGSQPYLRGRLDESSFTKRCFFGIDLTDNSVLKSGTGASSIEITFEDSVDGWKKVIFTATYDGTPTGTGLSIFLGSGDSMGTDIGAYAGDGSTFFHIYGLQVEQGSYPTSYIPTYGVSQTRLRDSAIASVINTTSRTYFLDGKRLADEGIANTSPIYDPNDALKITFWSNNRFRFRFGGQINYYYTLSGDDFKIALSYNGTDSKIFINGQLEITQTSFDLGNLSVLSINGNESISYNQLLLFPTALTDTECIALTTL